MCLTIFSAKEFERKFPLSMPKIKSHDLSYMFKNLISSRTIHADGLIS